MDNDFGNKVFFGKRIHIHTCMCLYIHMYIHTCIRFLQEFSEKTLKSSQKIKEIRGDLTTTLLIMKAVDMLLELALLKLN